MYDTLDNLQLFSAVATISSFDFQENDCKKPFYASSHVAHFKQGLAAEEVRGFDMH
jgi:hypothetical protein